MYSLEEIIGKLYEHPFQGSTLTFFSAQVFSQ